MIAKRIFFITTKSRSLGLTVALARSRFRNQVIFNSLSAHSAHVVSLRFIDLSSQNYYFSKMWLVRFCLIFVTTTWSL